MDKKSFKKLNEEERRLKLIRAISLRTQRLPFEDAEAICEKVSDLDVQYRINVYNYPGQFFNKALNFKEDEDLYKVLSGNISCSVDGYDFNPDKACSFEKHKVLRSVGPHDRQICNRSIEIYIPDERYDIDPILQDIKNIIDRKKTL